MLKMFRNLPSPTTHGKLGNVIVSQVDKAVLSWINQTELNTYYALSHGNVRCWCTCYNTHSNI